MRPWLPNYLAFPLEEWQKINFLKENASLKFFYFQWLFQIYFFGFWFQSILEHGNIILYSKVFISGGSANNSKFSYFYLKKKIRKKEEKMFSYFKFIEYDQKDNRTITYKLWYNQKGDLFGGVRKFRSCMN